MSNFSLTCMHHTSCRQHSTDMDVEPREAEASSTAGVLRSAGSLLLKLATVSEHLPSINVKKEHQP